MNASTFTCYSKPRPKAKKKLVLILSLLYKYAFQGQGFPMEKYYDILQLAENFLPYMCHLSFQTKEMTKRQVILKKDDFSDDDSTNSSFTIRTVRYRECQKNHAASVGGYAVDGCREFMPCGEEETPGGLTCAACGCHRNFHRREVETEVACDCSFPT